jgi:NAD(P)-dependent dehydrogenase (short-subunit alcohol dehydrogenase family)
VNRKDQPLCGSGGVAVDLQLVGKTALVSGSTAGIGLAIASGLAQEGATVYVNGRTEPRVLKAMEQVRALKEQVKQTQGTVEGITADLGNAEGCVELFSQLPNVDILVNNLGIFEPKLFAHISDEDWRRFFEVNVLSGVRLSRQYLPGMLKNNWGRILFISSESAVQIPVEMIHYGMTKTAQLAVARGLAESVAGSKVTVNSILAGPTRSEGVSGFVGDLAKQKGVSEAQVEKEFFETIRPSSLIKRFATPEEVASLVVYIASERSAATTGAALRVDGGVVRSIL